MMAFEYASGSSGVLGVLGCGTRPLSKMPVRNVVVKHRLRGGYKRDLHAFKGEDKHNGRSGAPEEENRGRGAARDNQRRAGLGDVALGYTLR